MTENMLKRFIVGCLISFAFIFGVIPQEHYHEQVYWGERVSIIIRYAEIENASAQLFEMPRGDWDWEFDAYKRTDFYVYDAVLFGLSYKKGPNGLHWLHLSFPGIYEDAFLAKEIPSLHIRVDPDWEPNRDLFKILL